MLTPLACRLRDELGGEQSGVSVHFVKHMGHVAPFEMRREFAKMIKERITQTDSLPR